MSNKIVQSSNAVIDYTTIQSLIDAVNAQQQAIDNLSLSKQQYSTKVNSDGTVSVAKVGEQINDSGVVKATSLVTNITFNKAFTQRPNIAMTVSGGSQYAFIANGNAWNSTNSSVNVTINSAPGSGTYIHWVAVGV